MKRLRNCSTYRLFYLTLLMTILLTSNSEVFAQKGRVPNPAASGEGRAQMLYGDLKVDESQINGIKPQAYVVVLYLTRGVAIGRQTVPNNGRYRFMDVPNGDYDLVVEVEGQEVARLQLVIHEQYATDVRHDIAMEWKGNLHPVSSSTVSVVDAYQRTAANQSLYEKSLEATRKGSPDEGIALLQQLVQNDPKDFVAWTDLGTAQFKKAKYDEAEKSYGKALEAKPNFIVALMNFGKLRLAQKNFEGAIDIFTRAVADQPQSADANHYLGESYLQVKKGSKAVGYLNKAIELDPLGKADIHLRLATLYNGANMKDRAALEYEKFLTKKPDYPDRKKLEQYISENKK
jgi:tetratricopeptide (TPR) repeat protein